VWEELVSLRTEEGGPGGVWCNEKPMKAVGARLLSVRDLGDLFEGSVGDGVAWASGLDQGAYGLG